MASPPGLRHDDLLFLLFGLAHHIYPEDSVSARGEPGRLLQQGFLWTTKYLLAHEHFFAIRGNREPDGHMIFETGSLLVTIEATTDPSKPNLEPQLRFYSSRDYQTTVVDQKYHEIWLFTSTLAYNVIAANFDKLLGRLGRELDVPVVLWRVDYDRQRHTYIVEKTSGTHSTGVPIGANVPPARIETGRPQTYPLLSSHLSFAAVCFAVGRELLGEILYPKPPRTTKEFHESFPANAVPFSYFSKAIGYLHKIVPELIEVSKGPASHRTIRVKRNIAQVDEIQRKLAEIRDCESEEDVIALLARYEVQPLPTKPSVTAPRVPETTLDDFMS